METLEGKLIYRIIHEDDRHAFASLIRRHQSKLRNFLRRLTKGDHALADDLAQESFMIAYNKIRQLDVTGSFSAWLFRIAYRVFLQHMRKQRDDHETLDEGSIAIEETHESIDKLTLDEALKKLSFDERLVITLHYFGDFSHSEITKITSYPLGTVKSHSLRATEKLKKLLGASR
ncbi:MAG: RNA polymerase sigma factor [Francisellaceae bacterium]